MVRADQKTTRECYAAKLKTYPQEGRRKINRSEVVMEDLDPRTNTDDQLEPLGETQSVIGGKVGSQTTTMAKGLKIEMLKEIRSVYGATRT